MTTIPLSDTTSRRLRMPELARHLVIVGPAGSGKSYTVRTLVREYTQAGQPDVRRVYAYDPKKAGFTAATGVPDLNDPTVPAADEPHQWVTDTTAATVLHTAQHLLATAIRTTAPTPALVVLDHLELRPLHHDDTATLIDLLTHGADHGVHVVLALARLDEPVVSPALREAIEQHADLRTTPLPGMFYACGDGGPARLVVADWLSPDQVMPAGVDPDTAHAMLAELAAVTHTSTRAHHRGGLALLGDPHNAHQLDRLVGAARNWFDDHFTGGDYIAIQCVDHDGPARLECRIVPRAHIETAGDPAGHPGVQAADQERPTRPPAE